MDVNETILITLLSAGSALFGAIAGELFKTVRVGIEHKKQRRDLLREKYEELAERVSDSHDWVESVFCAIDGEQLLTIGSARHGRRIETLANLYFIEIRDAATKYNDELGNLYNAQHKYLNHSISSATASSAIDAAREARLVLEKAVIEYSSKYT